MSKKTPQSKTSTITKVVGRDFTIQNPPKPPKKQ